MILWSREHHIPRIPFHPDAQSPFYTRFIAYSCHSFLKENFIRVNIQTFVSISTDGHRCLSRARLRNPQCKFQLPFSEVLPRNLIYVVSVLIQKSDTRLQEYFPNASRYFYIDLDS